MDGLLLVAVVAQLSFADWWDDFTTPGAPEVPDFGTDPFGWVQLIQWWIQRSAIPFLLGLAVIVVVAKVVIDWIKKARHTASDDWNDAGGWSDP